MTRASAGVAVSIVLLCSNASPAAQFSEAERASRAAATQENYRQTLQMLGLGAVRQGVDGLNPRASNPVNYDESKIRTYHLPPLLTLQNGNPVRTPGDWWNRRRPELVRLFDREVYGGVPSTAPQITWKLEQSEQRLKAGRLVNTRRYRGEAIGDPKLAIELDVTVPAKVNHAVPMILELGFPEGFHFPGLPPTANAGPDWTEQVVARGWGYAILVPYTVQPDDGAGLAQGVIGLSLRGRQRREGDWGALRAWAWGASRAYDLIARNPRIDAHRIAVEGLSRYGKAALVTMAYDRRFSIGFIGSSGAGGAKLLRRNYGEQIENLASSGEYHWFTPNFIKYAGPLTVDDLPVDAHDLIALVAPRPLFIGAGTVEHGDGWVDSRGSFDAAKAASPVYRLLGVSGLVANKYPRVGELRDTGKIAFRQQPDGHSNALNWPAFLTFAAREWRIDATSNHHD